MCLINTRVTHTFIVWWISEAMSDVCAFFSSFFSPPAVYLECFINELNMSAQNISPRLLLCET